MRIGKREALGNLAGFWWFQPMMPSGELLRIESASVSVWKSGAFLPDYNPFSNALNGVLFGVCIPNESRVRSCPPTPDDAEKESTSANSCSRGRRVGPSRVRDSGQAARDRNRELNLNASARHVGIGDGQSFIGC